MTALAACGRINFDPVGGSGSVDASAVNCDPRAGQILFWVSLDDAAQQTVVGAPGAAVPVVADFVEGRCGGALRLDTQGDVLVVDQIDGSSTHVDFVRGSLEMWYRPLYNTADDQEHRLFGNSDYVMAGGIRITKAGAIGNNQLRVEPRDVNGFPAPITTVSAGDVPFVPNVWVHVAVAWDFTVPLSEQNARVYFDGVEAPTSVPSFGPVTMRTANDSQSFYVGGFDVDDPGSAAGLFDEVIVYADPR
ncbi:MAG TPA: LamG-like jellyroll fold domain-containing protein [Kofleriaceae bacterium]